MNIKEPSRVLNELSRERIQKDLDLLPGILSKIQQEKRAAIKSRVRWSSAILLATIVLMIVFFTQPGVALALKNLVGFIPGVGTVDQSAPLRVLAGPVTDTRAGYTITVQSAVLDSNRTVIDYQISGPFQTWEDPSLKPVTCQGSPTLRLDGDQPLAYLSSEGGSGGGEYQWQTIFPAIDSTENKAALVFTCLPELPANEGPQDWEIPLVFAPAPPDMTVFPVVELPTPVPEKQAGAISADWIRLTLVSAAVLDDGYYLQAGLDWQKDPAIYEVQIYPDSIKLFDAGGQEVPIWFADQIPPLAPSEKPSLALNLQTAPIPAPGPARLVLDYVGVNMPASTSFSFDVGEAPQPGQTWQLDQDIEVNGHALRVLSAEYIQPSPGDPAMLMLSLDADSDVLMVTAMDQEHEILGTGGSPNSEHVPFRAGWRYKDGFPKNTITVDITTITLRRTGPWSVTWTPSAQTAAPTTPPTNPPPTILAPALPHGQATCAEDILFQTALKALPEGLGGRVAFTEWTGENHALMITNLDGSNRIPFGDGAFPALSPDGKRVAYHVPDDGLHVRDLTDERDIHIVRAAAEDIFDNWPKWSPDGKQIAFERVTGHTADIYLVNPDGSNLRALIDSTQDERFLGWSPDWHSILYTVLQTDGQRAIRALDLQTGITSEKGLLPPGILSASLSPDGERLLYFNEQGMFLSPMNEIAPVMLLASTTHFGNQIHPSWSPDGRWIALTYWVSEAQSIPGLALLQPDICQIVLLPEQKAGWLSSWVP